MRRALALGAVLIFIAATACTKSDFDARPLPGGKGVAITSYKGNASHVKIPSRINGLPVLEIDGNIFSDQGDFDIGSIASLLKRTFFGTSLKKITIPASVTSIDDGVFSSATLQKINVKWGNKNFASSGGVLFTADKKTLLCFPKGKWAHYKVPRGVTSINSRAFFGCVGLFSITIPNSVTSIEVGTFSSLDNLTKITIGNGVTSVGAGVFSGLNNLESVIIGNGVTTIGDRTFSGLRNLTSVTLGKGVTSIGRNAFNDCRNLVSITIPASVTSIDASAFDGARFASINVANGNTAIVSVDGVLYNIDQTVLIKFPQEKTGSFVIPAGVTSIGQAAFADCANLTSVTIGANVTSIEERAFAGCANLASVIFEGEISADGFVSDTRTPVFFLGDLRAKYLAQDGGPGTYTNIRDRWGNIVWTKQVPPPPGSRTVIIDMYDSSSDGWDDNGAVRINVNGTDIPSARLYSGGFGTYTFYVMPSDEVQLYWTGTRGNHHDENAFVVYYADAVPVPAFTQTGWNGTNALFFRASDSLSNADINQLLGSFTVQ